MLEIITRIYAQDLNSFQFDPLVGRCAVCGDSVTEGEAELVNIFWLDFCANPEPDIYLDVIFQCETLESDQFNNHHEPLICLKCLKQAIHHE